MKKSIYVFKRTSRQWYNKFRQIIISYGFEVHKVDDCVYYKFSGSKYVFLVLYVDDVLLVSSDIGLLHETKRFLTKNFEMKDLGDASFVLGIQIHRDRSRGILGLSQKSYIERVLDRFGMKGCALRIPLLLKEASSVTISAPRMGWNGKKCKRFLKRQV